MKKELTISAPVTTAISTYTGSLISEDSFNALSDIINRIANSKEELTDGMRQAATQYADTWDDLVVTRLNGKAEQLNALKGFFEMRRPDYVTIEAYCSERTRYGSLTVPMSSIINMLRTSSSKTWNKVADQFDDVITSVEELEEENNNNKPCRDDYFEMNEREMSYDERIIAQKKYELDLAKHSQVTAKKQAKIRVAFVKALSELLQDPDIKELLKALKVQMRTVKSAQSIVHEKSALVKLAINFGGTELLKALQELHEFQKGL